MFLELENVCFQYEDTKIPALEKISFTVNRGEKIAVVGPSGAGKTSLFYLLSGLYKPVLGKIFFNNYIICSENNNFKKLRRFSGLLMQFPEKQIFESTVFDEIAFGPKNFGIEKKEIKKLVTESMRMTGLDFEKFSGKSPLRISLGEKRKVAIASILALNPDILLFDEPTSALDFFGFSEIESIIKYLNSRGKTIFAISHDLELLNNNFDRFLGLKNGQLIIDEKKEEFFKNTGVLKELELKV